MNELSKYKNNEINSEMQKVMEQFEKKIENQNKKIESLTKEKQQKIQPVNLTFREEMKKVIYPI